jgi:hypothetical protein
MSTITLILSDFRAFQIIRFVKTTPFYLKNTCLFIVLGILISCSANDKESNNEQSDFQYGKKELLSAIHEIDNSGILANSTKIIIDIDTSLSDKNKEAYAIDFDENSINIVGGSNAGVLYGCKAAAAIILKEQKLPKDFQVADSPAMNWRGISLQLMKLGEYNYAITPEEFPFFYDKTLWGEFLDFMVDQRFNYIILWNGHPFDYFVKFDKYKEAQSGMTDEQIQQNNELLKWLIAEGKKRNIKFFFEFYNIHTSVYYQKAHDLPKQISTPTPELVAYTEYSIAKFVSEFPEVGLFVTPGEGLAREYSDDWINNVIFKAVKSTGFTPTIFMRAWFFDLEHAKKVTGNYEDLHFVRKFNVEMIADKRVDPENKEWAKLNGNFIVNIHLAANLEPFRWNPPSYIQEIVKNNIEAGSTGIHMHPRKAWRWPYGSEAGTKEYQWRRDMLFFTAWSRYSWQPDREKLDEKKYWIDLLTKRYGSKKAAEHFLKASETGADVLPALQRLIWLGDSNHSIVTAGATLVQLQNAGGIPFLSLDDTMRISEYLEALKSGKKMEGKTTPIAFIATKINEAKESLNEAKKAAEFASLRLDEAAQIVNDAEAIVLVTEYYWHKLQALKAWYLMGEGIDVKTNKKLFIQYLEHSVADYKKLGSITENTYESMSDVPAWHPIRFKKTPYHWKDFLPLYEKELNIYKNEMTVVRTPNFYEPRIKNLSGTVYRDSDFKNPKGAYPSTVIDFNWDNDKEIGKNWSIKWSGYLKAPMTGEFKIIFSADRDERMIIGDKIIQLKTTNKNEIIERFTFEKGKYYPIDIFYNHRDGTRGFVKLEWSYEGQLKEIIPEKYFFHSEAQDYKIALLHQLRKGMN